MSNARLAALMAVAGMVYMQEEGKAVAVGGQATKVIPVNPLGNPINIQVETNLVELKKAKFSFRTATKINAETGQPEMEPDTKDASGNVLKKGGEVKWKRPTLEVNIPMLTKAGLITALQSGDKSMELALEQANEAILQRARSMIATELEKNEGVELTPEVINLDELSFLKIAELPRGERGSGISKEDWQAFVDDYMLVMQSPEAIALFPDHKPRSLDILKSHATLLAGKFNQVKSRKDVVTKMDNFLDVWAGASKSLEEFQAQYELLKAKAKAIMEGEDFNNL